MKVNYYFMVCKQLHKERTRPLYETVIKRIIEEGDNFYLLGGFYKKDDIPIIKVCKEDDYTSCVEKIEAVFQREWDDADWHMICDDDTFIHTPNLKKFLSDTSTSDLRIYSSIPNGIYGGAGILMNNKTFMTLHNHVQKCGWKQTRKVVNHSDIALYHVTQRYNRKTKLENRRNNRILLRWPETMINFDSRCIHKGNIAIRPDLISVHLKELKNIWSNMNINDCPYKAMEKELYYK
jgi:hypothetical protein